MQYRTPPACGRALTLAKREMKQDFAIFQEYASTGQVGTYLQSESKSTYLAFQAAASACKGTAG